MKTTSSNDSTQPRSRSSVSDNLPRHIAIIPDANRRWARKRGLKPWMGHFEGVKRFEEVGDEAWKLGIRYLTFWGASADNIKKRSKQEVRILFKIFRENFLKIVDSKEVRERQIRIRVLGEWRELFPETVKKAIQSAIDETQLFNKGHLTFLLGYDGKLEMLNAVNSIVSNFAQHNPGVQIDEKIFKTHLYTAELPPVDLVIRTGGEPHLSAGFLMWDVAYAQLYFTDTAWPDFKKKQLREALKDYAKRQRRMGK